MEIQRLNMDNSWLIHFSGQRILIDPWLTGLEVDFFPWFNTQWHRTPPVKLNEVPDFDWVLITQKYPDHFHKETLQQLPVKKIVAPLSIQTALKALLPNATVQSFHTSPKNINESNINLHFLPTSRKIDPIYDAILLENGEQSILIASHGYPNIDLWEAKLQNLPPVHLVICPFDHYQLPFFLGGTVAPGLPGVEKLSKVLQPKYIVATHDEDKHAKGLVSKFASIQKAPPTALLLQNPLLQDRYLEINHYEKLRL